MSCPDCARCAKHADASSTWNGEIALILWRWWVLVFLAMIVNQGCQPAHADPEGYYQSGDSTSLTPQFTGNIWSNGWGTLVLTGFRIMRMAPVTIRSIEPDLGIDTTITTTKLEHAFASIAIAGQLLDTGAWVSSGSTVYLPEGAGAATGTATAFFVPAVPFYCCGQVDSLRTAPAIYMEGTLVFDGANGWRDTTVWIGQHVALRVGPHLESRAP